MRCAAMLRRQGQRALLGSALTLAVLALLGNLAFDHVWQALFFIAVGMILRAAIWGVAAPVGEKMEETSPTSDEAAA